MILRADNIFFIVVGLVCLVAGTAVDLNLSFHSQIALLVIVVALFGLPHGALDVVISQRLGLFSTTRRLLGFHVFYLALVALVLVIWSFAPAWCLAGFLLISSWHFGGDWSGVTDRAGCWLLGIMVLSLPAAFNTEQVVVLYSTITGVSLHSLVAVQAMLAPIALVGAAAVSSAALGRNPHLVAEIVMIFALAWTLPPLMYFTVYFCGLHSMRHLLGTGFLPNSRTVFIASAYTLVAIGIGVALASSQWDVNEALGIPIKATFQLLAALTVPHMILIDGFVRDIPYASE